MALNGAKVTAYYQSLVCSIEFEASSKLTVLQDSDN